MSKTKQLIDQCVQQGVGCVYRLGLLLPELRSLLQSAGEAASQPATPTDWTN